MLYFLGPLYFVRSLRRAPIQNENALLDLVGTLVRGFLERMGPLAAGLPALDGLLSAAVANSDARGDAGGQDAH